jgi:hypothetical protein
VIFFFTLRFFLQGTKGTLKKVRVLFFRRRFSSATAFPFGKAGRGEGLDMIRRFAFEKVINFPIFFIVRYKSDESRFKSAAGRKAPSVPVQEPRVLQKFNGKREFLS